LKIPESFKDQWRYNHAERRSIIVLIALCFIVTTIFHIRNKNVKTSNADFTVFDQIVADYETEKNIPTREKEDFKQWTNQIEKSQTLTKSDKNKKPFTNQKSIAKEKPKLTFEKFYFDPNTVDKDQMKRLGIPDFSANALIKYRNKGGQIEDAIDFAKIYGIDESLLNELAPFIKIKEHKTKNTPIQEKEISRAIVKTKQKINLNTADTTLLKSLYGIGSFYARNIVDYREKLGGFHQLSQLKEVFAMRDSTILLLEDQIFIDGKDVEKINLNLVTSADLRRHPYIDYKTAQAIIKYRDQHGSYKQIADLKRIYSIKSELYTKLEPYLGLKSEQHYTAE